MKVWLLLVTLVFSASASAFIPFPGESSTVEADLICQQEGGGMAIALPTKSKSPRVWMVDPEIPGGTEINVIEFQLARCRGCFNFKAEFLGMVLEGKASNFHLIVRGAYEEDEENEDGVILDAQCVPAK